MKDELIDCLAYDGKVSIKCISSKEIVETARKLHDLSPTASAALGRLLTITSIMGYELKTDEASVTNQIKGDGPIGILTAVGACNGNVKGYVGNPNVIIPANYAGKLDVGAAIGYGTLTVIKDMGLKEPYSSQVPLGTSEVAEDLTYYFATSEQVPSAVALGVLMEKNNTVKQAGGFIVQLMPFAEKEQY
jgi:molecular chaperone Hsp33